MAHHHDQELVQCWQQLIQLHASAKMYRDGHAEGAWRQAFAGQKLDADLGTVDVLLRRMQALRGEQQRIEKLEAARAVRRGKG